MNYKNKAKKLMLIVVIVAVSIVVCSCGEKSSSKNVAMQSKKNISQSIAEQGENKDKKLQRPNTITANEVSNTKSNSSQVLKKAADEKKISLTSQVKNRDIALQNQADNTKESKSASQNIELAGNVKTAMDKAGNYICDYYSKQKATGLADWPVIALRSAENNLKTDKWKNEINEAVVGREKEIQNEIDFDTRRATDYQRTILALVSLGRDPRSFWGKDWLEAIKNSQQKNGKFADSVDEGGDNLMNAHVWGIISLYTAGEQIPDKQKAYDWLVRHQNSDGGFGIDVASKASDIDMTGMSLTALGMLGKSSEDKCVQKALGYLRLRQLNNGGFKLWEEENPESAAAVVQGLIAIGEDPLSERWNKENGKNPINFILSFQLPNGSFKHTWEGVSDMTATSKSLMALGDYYYKKSVFKRLIK